MMIIIDHGRNTTVRFKTLIAQKAPKLKWAWAGQVSRMRKAVSQTTFWSPDTAAEYIAVDLVEDGGTICTKSTTSGPL